MYFHDIKENLKIIVKGIFLLYIILSSILYTVTAYSEDEIQLTGINTGGIIGTTNGGIIDITDRVNDNGENEIHGNIDTSDLEHGYYTTFIFGSLNENWSGYDGFAFHMENKGDNLLQLNFNIENTDGIKLSIPDDKLILIKNDSRNIIERVILSNGTFEIYPGFDGIIYIPFKSLRIIDSSKNDLNYLGNDEYNSSLLSQVRLWGIPMTCMDNMQINFKLSRFSIINAAELKDEYLNDDIKIAGNDRVMIPTAGESIEDYSILDLSNASFEILDDIDYVHMSEDGRLIVYDKAEPQNIRICAVSGKLGVTKEVDLYKSWTSGVNYDDGISMQILKPEDMKVILEPDSLFMNKSFIAILRIVFVLVCVAFGGLFFYLIKKSKIR